MMLPDDMNNFLDEQFKIIESIYKKVCSSYWTASISGKAEDYKIYEDYSMEFSKIYSNKENFQKLKDIKEILKSKDSLDKDAFNKNTELLKRSVDVMYNAFLGSQVDEEKLNELIILQSNIEKSFSTFRADLDGQNLTDNQIENILNTSTDGQEVKKAWLAHKSIGKVVEKEIIDLVKKRNATAVELGFNNYHDMSLILGEQDPDEILHTFDKLDELITPIFVDIKAEIDNYLAQRFGINKNELMPWHYQDRFFQKAPKIYKTNFDQYYNSKNLIKMTSDYYNSIGLEVDDIINRSDHFEKEGKTQHAYCIDIDRAGDTRVLCNVVSDSKRMGTMLHEYGHAVYNKYIDSSLPFVIRDAAHTFTTEAIAMLFGRFAFSAKWIKDMLSISHQEEKDIYEDGKKTETLNQIVFSRWSQVMFRFEREMYRDPDQDLNKLWKDLVQKYQGLSYPEGRQEPDWASKIHLATAPCYYHNYQLGELLASQLYYYIANNITNNVANNIVEGEDKFNQSFFGNKDVGKYLIDKIFSVGSRYKRDSMIENATGEKLDPKYYAMQFMS